MGKIELRLCDVSDCDLIYNLNNDKEYRCNSFNQEAIKFEEHNKWFKKKLESKDDMIYIAILDNKPIGTVRLDKNSDQYIISYTIDKRYRGQGYGKVVLLRLEEKLLSNDINSCELCAKVKIDNIASQKIFLDLGYTEYNRSEYYEYIKKINIKNIICDNIQKTPNRPGGVLFLTNNRNTIGLFEWIKVKQDNINLYSSKIFIEQIVNMKPDIIISYNYIHIIPEDVIEFMNGNIINLHISLLPWNRGSSPNFWSFIDDTPKGVTIHRVDKGLDTGKILYQKELFFDEDYETFHSTYEKLNFEIQKLFKDNWENIKTNKYNLFDQVGDGSYHTKKELIEHMTLNNTNWNENISSYKKRIKINDRNKS